MSIAAAEESVGIIENTAMIAGASSMAVGATGWAAEKAGIKIGAGIAARVAFKFIPIVGWASLAYDGWQLANYAIDKYNEEDASVDILTKEEFDNRQIEEGDVNTILGAETYVAGAAVGAIPLTSLKDVASDVAESTPKGSRIKRFTKGAALFAAFEGAVIVGEDIIKGDVDDQYDYAKDFHDRVIDAYEGGGRILSVGDKNLIKTLSVEYGKAVFDHNGADMTEEEYGQAWKETMEGFMSSINAQGDSLGEMTLNNDEQQGLRTFLNDRMRESLQAGQYKSTLEKALDFEL